MSKGGGRQQTREKASGGRTAAEWVTLIVSIAIVGGLVGTLVYQQFESGVSEATLQAEVQLDDVREGEGGFYLPVTVENKGKQSAERITVEIVAGDDPEPLAEFEVEALPGHASVTAVAVLEMEPGEDVEAVITSFVEP